MPTSTPIPPSPTPPPSVAIVNGEYITIAEFQAELTRYKAAQTALGTTVTDQDASKTVLDDMISQVLLAQGARDAGFSLTAADLKSRMDALTSQLGGTDALQKWEADHGYDEASFQASLRLAAESAWMRDKIIAGVPTSTEQVHVQQILSYNEADANAALDQLKNGADFDQLAAQYDPVTHGELGWIPRGYLLDKKADEAVFALQPGSYSNVIATAAGFHIFKVLERGDHPLSPDALLTLQELALKDWLAKQRDNSAITLAP